MMGPIPKLIVAFDFLYLFRGETQVERGLFGLSLDRSRGSGLLRFTPDSHLIRAVG